MKILQVHISNLGRGGGIAAMNRLRHGLMKVGVQAKVLCLGKRVPTDDSVTINPSRVMNWSERNLHRITSRLSINDLHRIGSFRIRSMEAYQEADLIDFHCIHGGYFNYFALPGLTQKKPAVFTLHDMWPFTGHCHNSLDCDRWKIGCGQCPYPKTYPPIKKDTSHLEWTFKDWVYKHSNFAIITPSRWLTSLARQSMLNRFPIYHIPHGIDTEVYQPLDSDLCRWVLGIPPGKKVLLFVVDNLNRRLKGGDLLQTALRSLPKSVKAEILLLTIGNGGEALAKALDIPTLNLGYIESDRLKVICYSAADLFVLPTRADNFPLVLLESLACGTPMVSFRLGGVPDTIRPGITGYLAEPANAQDLCGGIAQLLQDDPLRDQMRQNCRAIAVQEYDIELQVRRCVALYRRLLESRCSANEDESVLEPLKTQAFMSSD